MPNAERTFLEQTGTLWVETLGVKLAEIMPEPRPIAKVCRAELAGKLRCKISYSGEVAHEVMLHPFAIL